MLESEQVHIRGGRIVRHPVERVGPVLPVRSYDRTPRGDGHFQMLGRCAFDFDDLIDVGKLLGTP